MILGATKFQREKKMPLFILRFLRNGWMSETKSVHINGGRASFSGRRHQGGTSNKGIQTGKDRLCLEYVC